MSGVVSSHPPATVTTTTGLSINGQEVSLATATDSIPGSLSAADHATFNGKQDRLLTGLTTADGTVLATDNVLQAFGKVVGEQQSRADQLSSGFISWGGSGNYYSYSSGTFTILRPGVGRLLGSKITWAGGESVSGLSTNKGYLIGYSATNTLTATDITTLSNTSVKTTFENYKTLYENNVIMFGIWTDGADPVIVKENHPFSHSTDISINEHFRLGQTFSSNGALLSVLSAANRTIQSSGEDMLNDHGLTTRIPDAATTALDCTAIFQNAGGTAQGLNRRTFTVSGVTVTPTAGATYTNNSSTFTVLYTTIVAGSGTISTWISSGVNNPSASGTLTKASGTGDASITFSAYSVAATIASAYAPAGVPASLTSSGATRYGIVAIYASKDDLQSVTPKYFQLLSNTAYSSTAAAANSIGTGTIPDLTQFVMPAEMRAIELVLNGFVLIDGNGRTIPSVTTNGFTAGVKTTKAAVGSVVTTGTITATTAVNVSNDTTNFNRVLSSSEATAQLAFDKIDDIMVTPDSTDTLTNKTIGSTGAKWPVTNITASASTIDTVQRKTNYTMQASDGTDWFDMSPSDKNRNAQTLENFSFLVSSASNILTVEIRDLAAAVPTIYSPVVIGFPVGSATTASGITLSITASKTITVPVGALLGTTDGVETWLDFYISSLGELAISNGTFPDGHGISYAATFLDTSSDSAGVLYGEYAGGARVYRRLGRFLTHRTGNNWASPATAIEYGYKAGTVGSTSGIAPSTGMVGEYLESDGTSTELTSGIYNDCGSAGLTLAAGTWDIQNSALIYPASTTRVASVICGIGTASGSSSTGVDPVRNVTGVTNFIGDPQGNYYLSTPMWRVNTVGSTTYYPKVYAVFDTSTCTGECLLKARRVA
jgi:hypothetical protein